MNDLKNLQAPHNFGVCASACCTKRFTCLRYIALQNASLQYPFLPMAKMVWVWRETVTFLSCPVPLTKWC